MPSLHWRLLLLAVLPEPALAYRSGPSAFARGVSHRQPSLSRFAARAPVPACAATPPPDAAERERLPAAVLPITLTVFAQMIGEGLALTSLPLHMKSLGASHCEASQRHPEASADAPSSTPRPAPPAPDQAQGGHQPRPLGRIPSLWLAGHAAFVSCFHTQP